MTTFMHNPLTTINDEANAEESPEILHQHHLHNDICIWFKWHTELYWATLS